MQSAIDRDFLAEFSADILQAHREALLAVRQIVKQTGLAFDALTAPPPAPPSTGKPAPHPASCSPLATRLLSLRLRGAQILLRYPLPRPDAPSPSHPCHHTSAPGGSTTDSKFLPQSKAFIATAESTLADVERNQPTPKNKPQRESHPAFTGIPSHLNPNDLKPLPPLPSLSPIPTPLGPLPSPLS